MRFISLTNDYYKHRYIQAQVKNDCEIQEQGMIGSMNSETLKAIKPVNLLLGEIAVLPSAEHLSGSS